MWITPYSVYLIYNQIISRLKTHFKCILYASLINIFDFKLIYKPLKWRSEVLKWDGLLVWFSQITVIYSEQVCMEIIKILMVSVGVCVASVQPMFSQVTRNIYVRHKCVCVCVCCVSSLLCFVHLHTHLNSFNIWHTSSVI